MGLDGLFRVFSGPLCFFLLSDFASKQDGTAECSDFTVSIQSRHFGGDGVTAGLGSAEPKTLGHNLCDEGFDSALFPQHGSGPWPCDVS